MISAIFIICFIRTLLAEGSNDSLDSNIFMICLSRLTSSDDVILEHYILSCCWESELSSELLLPLLPLSSMTGLANITHWWVLSKSQNSCNRSGRQLISICTSQSIGSRTLGILVLQNIDRTRLKKSEYYKSGYGRDSAISPLSIQLKYVLDSATASLYIILTEQLAFICYN